MSSHYCDCSVVSCANFYIIAFFFCIFAFLHFVFSGFVDLIIQYYPGVMSLSRAGFGERKGGVGETMLRYSSR